MFLLLPLLSLLPIASVHGQANFAVPCSNGRQALYTFDVITLSFSLRCPTPGQPCRDKMGQCNDQHLCCPRTLKMSSKPYLYDRASNMKFIRIGSDHKHAYRLFQVDLLPNSSRPYDFHARWLFFDGTLRDLFEMPHARFWFPIIQCMQNQGLAYAFVPLNATSVTLNVNAMTILSRKYNALNSIYVCYMATKKEHRRQGLGTRLLQQIVHRSLDEQQNGIKYVTMHVNTLNTVALELYERCGWRCYAYIPFHLDREPHHATTHAYALRLRLDAVRNVTGLCRDPNAIVIDPIEDEQSVRNCSRQPAHL